MNAFEYLRWAGWILGFFLLVILTQDLQVFPAVLFSLHKRKGVRTSKVPRPVESIFIDTDDRKRLELWRLPAAEDIPSLPYIGLIFHGNGGAIESFYALQLWFHYLGITSYNFDYRGIGRSSGWPSERGLELDSDAVYRYVTQREKIGPDQLIIFGYSVGGAMAARVAAREDPKLLILMSAFTDVRRIVRDTLITKPFTPFLWWRLSTIDHIRALRTTSLIVSHGERDTTISSQHSRDLVAAFNGSGNVDTLFHETSGHNNLFFAVREELAAKMLAMFARESS